MLTIFGRIGGIPKVKSLSVLTSAEAAVRDMLMKLFKAIIYLSQGYINFLNYASSLASK